MSATGACKICASPHVGAINGFIEAGWNQAQVAKAALAWNLRFARPTFYAHVKHYKNLTPEATSSGPELIAPGEIKRTSNTEYLETIRDIAYTRIGIDPSQVTVEQGMKAVQILEGRKERTGDQLNLLISVVTGHTPAIQIQSGARRQTELLAEPTVIEGEVRELSEGET